MMSSVGIRTAEEKEQKYSGSVCQYKDWKNGTILES